MLPVPHIPDGLTIALIRRSAGPQGTEAIIPDNGQVERLNRTLKDATVRRYRYGSHGELRTHLRLLLGAYDHVRTHKTLRGLIPCESHLPGPKSPNGSGSTRHTTSRDHTPRYRNRVGR